MLRPRSPPLAINHPGLLFDGDFPGPSPAPAASAADSGLAAAPESHHQNYNHLNLNNLNNPNPDTTGLSSGSVKKRRRPPLSCEQCRRRKIRCDRTVPCSHCVKAKISPCTYAPTHVPQQRGSRKSEVSPPSAHAPAPSQSQSQPQSQSQAQPQAPASESQFQDGNSRLTSGLCGDFIRVGGAPRPSSEYLAPLDSSPSVQASTEGSDASRPKSKAKSKIDALETRLRQLEDKLTQDCNITPRNTDDRLEAHDETRPAPMKGTVSKTRFFGQSHWMNSAMLFPEVMMLRHVDGKGGAEPSSTFQKCKHLGRRIKEHRLKPISTDRLGKNIPERALAEKLVDLYFLSFEGILRVLHKPTFMAELQRYWQNPDASSDVFVMQFQLVMAIGSCLYDDTYTLRSSALQWVHEVQIWLLLPPEKSRMTIAGIQIMCMLNLAKASCGVGQDLTWVTMGGLVRQAMYMGLHRDPRHLGDMSVFRAEMRRRLWATILELNLQSAYDAGGPPLLSGKHYDTLPPANLDDEQLSDEPDTRNRSGSGSGVGTGALEGQPLTDMSVFLALQSSYHVRLAIIKHVNEFRSRESYPETLRLNSELTRACHSLVERLAALAHLQPPGDRAVLTHFHSSLVQLFVYRSFVTLHQPLLTREPSDSLYYYSRKVCLDCSLKVSQICGLSEPSNPSAPPGATEPHTLLDRAITNGSGMLRVLPMSAYIAVALEFIKRKEEDKHTFGGLPPVGYSELRLRLQAAEAWFGRRISAGETNVKGYVFLGAGLALTDSLEMGLDRAQVDEAVLERGIVNSLRAFELLKELAARDGLTVVDGEANDDISVGRAGEVGSVPSEEDGLMDIDFDWVNGFGWESLDGSPFGWTGPAFGNAMDSVGPEPGPSVVSHYPP